MDKPKNSEKESNSSFSKKETEILPLNRRKFIRYPISEISAGNAGTIIEVSRGGLKIKKHTDQDIGVAFLNVFNNNRADVVWQDKKHIGLRFAGTLNIDQLIRKAARKVKDIAVKSEETIPVNAAVSVTAKDVLGACIMLMSELDSSDVNMSKLKKYVREITDKCRENAASEEKGEEDIEGAGEMKPAAPADLTELILQRANSALVNRGMEVTDIDFAIARLGVDTVKKISADFMRAKIAEVQVSFTGFEQYKAFNILKTVIFKQLADFFSFKDEEGKGGLLLTLETKGIDILMSSSGRDLTGYYTSSQKIYSEVSRACEKKYFGRDMIDVNKDYFEHSPEMFDELCDGYVLAHIILNPWYSPAADIKLTLTQRTLVFSFLAHLSFLAGMFIIDRDKESGVSLTNILTKTGMKRDKVVDFINEVIHETNSVLRDLGIMGSIRNISLHDSSFRLESYLPRNSQVMHMIRSFSMFSMPLGSRRMAIRYEDSAYAHFVLTRFLSAAEFGLSSKAVSVVPCGNISDSPVYFEDFFFFDLLILKDIDRLSGSQKKDFEKLWTSFDGHIIATFSSYSFLDIDHRDLYELLREHIVDFPSYFSASMIYERMLDHTASYIKPFSGEQEFDRSKYANDIFSMNFVKSSELPACVRP